MASSSKDEDLLPEQTEGFKVGEKKTIDEYHKLGMWYLRSKSSLAEFTLLVAVSIIIIFCFYSLISIFLALGEIRYHVWDHSLVLTYQPVLRNCRFCGPYLMSFSYRWGYYQSTEVEVFTVSIFCIHPQPSTLLPCTV